MNSFEKMGCKDPANFRSWGLVFGIGCGVVGVLAVGAIVYVVFVKKKAKEGGLRTSLHVAIADENGAPVR